MSFSEIYSAAKAPPGSDSIFFDRSRHVETVVSLSHKNADSHINVNIEFGEGDGKIPVDKIAQKAEDYRPGERVTYKMIQDYIESKYGFKVHTAYIAEVKRGLGLPMYDAPNVSVLSTYSRQDAVSFLNSNGAAYHTLIIVSYDDGLVCAQHTGSNDARKLKDYTGDFIIYNMY